MSQGLGRRFRRSCVDSQLSYKTHVDPGWIMLNRHNSKSSVSILRCKSHHINPFHLVWTWLDMYYPNTHTMFANCFCQSSSATQTIPYHPDIPLLRRWLSRLARHLRVDHMLSPHVSKSLKNSRTASRSVFLQKQRLHNKIEHQESMFKPPHIPSINAKRQMVGTQ
jgi:hypothetical protein